MKECDKRSSHISSKLYARTYKIRQIMIHFVIQTSKFRAKNNFLINGNKLLLYYGFIKGGW